MACDIPVGACERDVNDERPPLQCCLAREVTLEHRPLKASTVTRLLPMSLVSADARCSNVFV